MMAASKPLGGLFSVPGFGLSTVLSKNTTKGIFNGHKNDYFTGKTNIFFKKPTRKTNKDSSGQTNHRVALLCAGCPGFKEDSHEANFIKQNHGIGLLYTH